MRILSVTETYAPFLEFGGPPVKVRALARGLVARGHDVTVLTADWGIEARTKADSGGIAKRGAYGWTLTDEGVDAIYLPTRLRRRTVTWNPRMHIFCRDRLREFDVVHIFGVYDLLGPALAFACSKQNIPYVVEPIGMFVPIVRSFWLKRMYHAVFGRRMFEGASAVIATAEQEVEELAGGGIPREKIILRRNGVEAPSTWPARGAFRKQFHISETAKVVLFLGRLSEKKSPDLLLRAFASIFTESSNKNLKLVFAGPDEGGMKARLAEMATQLGVAEQVTFAGAIFGDAKWAAYRDSDVFVLPSQNENFGNTAAESAAAGTPVVVTEQCGVAPLLANLAGLVVTHDADAVALAIKRLLSDHALHGRLSAGCIKVTTELGWENPVAEMERLYKRLANERVRSANFD